MMESLFVAQDCLHETNTQIHYFVSNTSATNHGSSIT